MPLPHWHLQPWSMTKDEARAIAFVGILLVLAVAARIINRPKPVTIVAAPVDVAALRAAGRELAKQGHAGRAASVQSTQPGPLDLNRASAAELEGLPGVGPAMAQRIIARRDSLGGFSNLEQLDSVRGIGPGLLGKLRPLVVIR